MVYYRQIKRGGPRAMTKTISGTYNTTTTTWTIRDNGEIILQGKGIGSWARALSALKTLSDKPVRTKTTH